MKRNQRVCLLYWTTWVVGALLVFLAENEIIPTGYATGVQTAYYLNLTAIVLTLAGIYVGLKFFHLPFVKRHIGTAPSATAALARWTSLRLIGMTVVGFGVIYALNAVIDKTTNPEVKHIDKKHPKTADQLSELIHSDHYEEHKKERTIEVTETLLFTTKTCPNCKAAKASLDKAGINYKVVDAEENPELAIKYGIMQAPTLVVNANGVDNILVGLSKIRGYISEAV